MEGIVSLSKGAMEPLLGKLSNLVGDQCTRMNDVRKHASFLKDELSAMNAVLGNLERMDDLDQSAKDWIGHVREMAYDVDDCVSDYMVQIGDPSVDENFIRTIIRCLRTLWARREIDSQIEELKARAIEANERRMRYMIHNDNRSNSRLVADETGVAIDARVPALYQEAACLVGIEARREELVDWSAQEDKELKVMAILGFGGVGKTTLAKHVYDKIGGLFGCKAFVSVSQCPNFTRLLSGIQFQLGIKDSSSSCEVNVIIDRIREHLENQRYIIIVDDLWDRSAWNIIRCSFPENSNGSRVIVTTRLEDVACSVCCNCHHDIYRMQPLDNTQARSLFFNGVFGSKYDCTSHFELEQVSTKILKKCGGLPLVITAVANILATCPARLSDWETINNSMSLQFATNPFLEGMKHVLNLSYNHLPLHLRPCFLYLGLYPEDCEVARDDLIHQWIAEGLVSAHLGGLELEDVAKGYFNELVNRNLIQPVKVRYGEVLSRRAHDMMLDLILTKCSEDNFITVARSSGDMEHMHHYKVRRLSMRLNDTCTRYEGIPESISESLSHVRSLAWFGKSTYIPDLLLFKYLRVVIIDTGTGTSVDLTAIGVLLQLRYLRVSTSDGRIGLPSKIQGLVNLETFYICGGSAYPGIPSDIFLLPRLSHLIVPTTARLPKGIENMKALHTLQGFEFGLKDIKSLGELTDLRNLKLCSIGNFDIGTTGVDALLSSIEKLCNLKYLVVDARSDETRNIWIKDEDSRLCSLSNPTPLIEVLKLKYWMVYRIPKWIGGLRCLRLLTLHVRILPADDMNVLGRLPSLVKLHLRILYIPRNRTVEISTGSFAMLEKLKILNEHGNAFAWLCFEAGAMPKLQKLFLLLPRGRCAGAAPVGIQHLLGLKEIYAVWNYGSQQDEFAAKAAFSNVTDLHPGHPSFSIILKPFIPTASLIARQPSS